MPEVSVQAPALIFHIPHASTFIPPDVRSGLDLTDDDLKEQVRLLTDHYTDVIFGAAARPGDVIVQCPVSRLVTDVERYPIDADEPMSECGMGAVYLRGHDGRSLRSSLAHRDALMQRYYYPHHRSLEEAVRLHVAEQGYAVIIDSHSFPEAILPYEADSTLQRPEVCIGTDAYHTPERLARTFEDAYTTAGFSVLRNTPFAGALVPLSSYHRDKRVSSVMIELRRDIYMDEKSSQLVPRCQRVKQVTAAAIEGVRRLLAF